MSVNIQYNSTMKENKPIGKNLTSRKLSVSVYEMGYLPLKMIMMTKENAYKMYTVKKWLITMASTIFCF